MEPVRCYCRTRHKIQRCILYQATTLTRKQDRWTAQASPVYVSRMCLKASKTTGPVSDTFSSGAGLFGLNGYVPRNRVWFSGSWVLNSRIFFLEFPIFIWPCKTETTTNGNWAIWLVYRTDTKARSLLSERSGEKTSCPRTFWKSLWRRTATRLANWSNNAFSILEFSLAWKGIVHVLIFFIQWLIKH